MRLLTKISIVYLLITVMVLLIGSVITFQTVQQEVDIEHRRFLKEQLDNIKTSLESGTPADAIRTDKIQIKELGAEGIAHDPVFSDTVVLHRYTQRMESNQKLKAVVKVDDLYYDIAIHDIIVEPDDIVDAVRASIWKIFLILLVVFATASIVLPWLMLRPFNSTLEAIRKFNLKDGGPIRLSKSSTLEFARLNRFIQEMTAKSKKDYESLKEFTENASHELQTPLAISRGKLDLLIESSNLREADLKLVNDAQNSIMKLSRVSRSLSLLTKIENQEFTNKELVNFEKLISNALDDLSDFIGLHELRVDGQVDAPFKVQMDRVLAEILINNIMRNAIRHNLPNGWIRYEINSKSIKVQNSGPEPVFPTSQLFERFKKGKHQESVGLGLAIVKQICDLNGLDIEYSFADKTHTVTIRPAR